MAIQGGKGEMRIVLKVKDDGSAVIEKFGNKAEQTGKKSSKAFDDFSAGAGVSFRGVATYAGMAAAAVVAVGVATVKAQIDIADSSAKSARAVGFSVEAYSALAYQASLTMKDVGQLDIALRTMTRNLGEAAAGGGPAKDALKDLGLNAKALAALSPDQALEEIADALDKVKNSNDKATLANKLFGESGSQMLLLMNGGKEAMRAARIEADRYGKTISKETAVAAEDFNKNITRMQANLSGMAMKITAEVLPALLRMTDAMLGNDNIDSLMRERARLALVYQNTIARRNDWISGTTQKDVDKARAEIDDVDNRIIAVNKRLQTQQAAAATGGAPAGAGRSKGDESAAKAAADLRAQEAERIAALSESLMGENELLANDYLEKQLLLQDSLNNNIITEGQFYSLEEALEAQHQKKLTDVKRQSMTQQQLLWESGWQGQMSIAADAMSAIGNLMMMGGEKQFKIGQKLNLLAAVGSTAAAITNALATPPFLLGLTLAVTAAAKGAAQIAAINKMSWNGGAGTVPSAGGGTVGTYPANPYSGIPEPQSQVPPPQNNIAVQRVERLTLVAEGPLSDVWVRDKLIPKINQAQRDGVRLEVVMA